MLKSGAVKGAFTIAAACAALLVLLSAQADPLPSTANESSIVPLSYKIATVELESLVSPTEASVRFNRDGVSCSESGDRSSYPFLHPLQGQACEVCREFGPVKDGPSGREYFHPGIDFRASEGAPVFAAASGKVERSGYTAGYGLFIVINHGSFSTLYGHLQKIRLVKKGDAVSAGQRIGSVGSTGDTAEALLHYEIRLSRSKSGILNAVDPRQFLDIAKRAGSRGTAASLAYGVEVMTPHFTFKEGKAGISCDLPDGAFSVRDDPAKLPLRNPLGANAGKVDCGFGQRDDPFTKKREFHTGVDIVCFWGCPVYAAGAGVVAKAGTDSGYGNFVIIRHGKIVTLYAHLKDLSAVSVGKELAAGQRIGVIGNTGKTTGPHLHYEIRLVTDADSGFKEEVKQFFDPQVFLDWASGMGIR
jgi:murein DD-endopeptidase MepM/ murein hydrolase activator NlpD